MCRPHLDLRRAPGARASIVCSGVRPNLEPRCPVAIASCVSASMPGVTRTSTRCDAGRARALGLVGRVEDDVARRLGRGAQVRVATCCCRARRAARRRCPAACANASSPSVETSAPSPPRRRAAAGHVRERLRPEDDERVRRRLAVGARPRPERLLAVDDSGVPCSRDELGRRRRRRASSPSSIWRCRERAEHTADPPVDASFANP